MFIMQSFRPIFKTRKALVATKFQPGKNLQGFKCDVVCHVGVFLRRINTLSYTDLGRDVEELSTNQKRARLDHHGIFFTICFWWNGNHLPSFSHSITFSKVFNVFVF